MKHGGGSLQVWGCISANGVGDLVRINGILNAEKYRQILIHHAIPSGRRMIGTKFILQQDNDPKHTANVIKNYLQHTEQQEVLEVMAWPPQSPDLYMGLHEETEGFEEVYIHRTSVVSSPRCLEQPTSRVPSKTVCKST